jgi:hypothetical protein
MAQRTRRFFYFPIGKSLAHGFSSVAILSSTFRRIGTHAFVSFSVDHRNLESPGSNGWSTHLLFPCRDSRSIATSPYLDFVAHDTKHSDFQLPSPDVPRHQYSPVAISLPHALATCTSRYLGFRLTSLELAGFPDLGHLFSTHFCGPTWLTSPSGYHVSQARNSPCQIFDTFLTRPR